MQFGLTEEQEMIVSTVRSFVETEIYPHEDEVERLDMCRRTWRRDQGQGSGDGVLCPNFPDRSAAAG